MVERDNGGIDYLTFLGTFGERIANLADRIGEIEELVGVDGNQDEALVIATETVRQYQLMSTPIEQIAEMDLRELAGLAQLHLMIVAIGLSRNRTLETVEDKRDELFVWGAYLSKAVNMGRILVEREFIQTVRGELFLWPVELKKSAAEFHERAAEFIP